MKKKFQAGIYDLVIMDFIGISLHPPFVALERIASVGDLDCVFSSMPIKFEKELWLLMRLC